MAKKSEIQINYTPSDVISCVTFSPSSSQYLAVSSWDGTVRLYDTHANAMRQKYLHSTPVLDCSFQVSSKSSVSS
jgi:cell cycle arrest protein BUB3